MVLFCVPERKVSEKTPPPPKLAELPEMVESLTVRVPSPLWMPPPMTAEFSLMVEPADRQGASVVADAAAGAVGGTPARDGDPGDGDHGFALPLPTVKMR